MAGVSGSTEAAEELQKKIRETAEEMVRILADYKKDLNRLEATAKDQSFETALYYYNATEQEIRNLMPQMSEVSRRLERYIRFIEKVELRIRSAAPASSGMPSASASSFRTREVFKVTDDGIKYDDPEKTGRDMRHRQTRGDCGLCAIENLTIMAGRHVSLEDITALAEARNLCGRDGSTTEGTIRRTLEEFGISSHLEEQKIAGIAAAVAGGHGVIIGVDAAQLSLYGCRNRFFRPYKPHALLVTGIVTDNNGDVTHVVVCDTNADALGLSGAITYTVGEIQRALIWEREMVVTDHAVR